MDSNHSRLFAEVQNEFKEKQESLTSAADHFKKVYESALGKLDGLFRKNCKHSIEWIEANTENTNEGPVLKDKSKSAEFEKTANELNECIKQNDVGSQDILMDFDNQMHAMRNKYGVLFKQCTTMKDESQLKSCFRNLITEQIQDMDQFYHNFSSKFDAMNKKL